MTRVISYNILGGGTHRVKELGALLQSSRPDIVGLIEAVDEQVVRELATDLGMQYCLSGRGADEEGLQVAVLSHLPLLAVKRHRNTILAKQPLLEVRVEEKHGEWLTVFVTHLTADFAKRGTASKARRQEIQEILRILGHHRGTRHLLMGDFNSLAPRERLKGSFFLQYATKPDLYYQLKPDPSLKAPDLDFVVPSAFHFINPLLKLVPESKVLSVLLDGVDAFYAPSGGIELLQKAGYVDCFRSLYPDQQGFTWPAPLPAGRVDFIFASPELAQGLLAAKVVLEGEGISATQASDHLPVFAEFGTATFLST